MLRFLDRKTLGLHRGRSSPAKGRSPAAHGVALFGVAGLLHLGSIGGIELTPEIRCSCMTVEDLSVAVSAADAVFVGTAVRSAVTSGTPLSDDEDGAEIVLPTRIVGFQVWSAWKGTMDSQTEVRTGMTGADCGFPFEEGATYLVFARADGEVLTTSICSRTAVVSDALRDLVDLGSPAFTPGRE